MRCVSRAGEKGIRSKEKEAGVKKGVGRRRRRIAEDFGNKMKLKEN